MTDTIDRRAFLKRSAATAGGALAATSALQRITEHAAFAAPARASAARVGHGNVPVSDGYGPLHRVADQRGVEVLALPAGFTYVTFGWTATPMLSGGLHPRSHDGMGSFAGPGGTVRLIRNHENRNARNVSTLGVPAQGLTKYDPAANGGCVTLDFDPLTRTTVAEFVSIAGTHVNCAGGIAYRDAGWITSEETTATYDKKHGYNFLVPAGGDGRAHDPVPLVAMGRFAHEAVAVDPRTGIVYETEDAGNNSGFYRFIPTDPADLTAGGTLQMLAVKGTPNYDPIRNQVVNRTLNVDWITIQTPDPDLASGAPSVSAQGASLGAARFNRLEGIWWDADRKSFFFNSTSGGDAGYGQVWEYTPGPTPSAGGTLALRFESPGKSVLDSPDNLNVTPRGGILLCEDDASGGDNDSHPLAPGIENVNRLIGLDRKGRPFEFAVNVMSDAELAGACWSPDGQILFVNVFGDASPGSGMTCAIFAPSSGWGTGLL